MNIDLLPLAWGFIIAFCVAMYVILDGFTLGTGMLLSFIKPPERDLATSVLLPTWDGNQTWLVLGGASLYGAFPMAFSLILPAFYLPVMLMVIALLFRGVIFEFRAKTMGNIRTIWDWVFAISSLIVTLIQGAILGNFIEGFSLKNGILIPSHAFISGFSIFTAIGLVIGYCLLGSTRLILKTDDILKYKMVRIAYICAFLIIVCVMITSVWTPFISPDIFHRWFHQQHWIYLMILPYISGLFLIILFFTLYRGEDVFPFWCTVILFLCAYLGLIISIFPYIIPFQITLWQGASSDTSLRFLLVGAVIMIPILLLYTGYAYHIFKGKVKNIEHY
jgi:cytochrome d ubiquinol oxidase subunit II